MIGLLAHFPAFRSIETTFKDYHLAIKRLSQSKLHSTEARKAFAANFFSSVMLVVNYHLGEEKKENPYIFAGRRNRFCCSINHF